MNRYKIFAEEKIELCRLALKSLSGDSPLLPKLHIRLNIVRQIIARKCSEFPELENYLDEIDTLIRMYEVKMKTNQAYQDMVNQLTYTDILNITE